MEKREYKQLPFYVQKTDDEQGIVDAIVAVMGNVDLQKDIIDPGAFTKTITERGGKIRVLDNHNAHSVRDVIGKPIAFREMGAEALPPQVLTDYPDATGGLFASVQFLMDTPEGKGAYQRIKSGAIGEYSIGYDALDTKYDTVMQQGKEQQVRRLKTIRLWEISPVIFGANPATATLAAKADEDKEDPEPSEGKPWAAFPEGDQYCIYVVDDEGNQVGESLGCHPTQQEAAAQLRALYASEEEDAGKASIECVCPECGHKVPKELSQPCNEIECPECGALMRLDVEGGKAEDAEPEQKVGRVLAQRNADRIARALGTLIEVLEDAGIDLPGVGEEPEEEEEDAGKAEGDVVVISGDDKNTGNNAPESEQAANTQQETNEAGPGEPPTSEDNKLLRLIELELGELELLEV